MKTSSSKKKGKSAVNCGWKVDKFVDKFVLENSSDDEIVASSSKALKSPPLFKEQMEAHEKSESSDSDSDAESRKAIMQSARKRIIQNLSTSESDSKKIAKPSSKCYGDPSDSESAPEEISFKTGHKLVKDSVRNAMESITREKKRKKEKRKQLLEKYKQQKEEKLIRLKEKRASQEDASCSSSEESGYEDDETSGVLGKSKKGQRIKQEKENVDDPLKSKAKKHVHEEDKSEAKEKKRKREKAEIPNNTCNLRRLPEEVLESLPDQIPIIVPKSDQNVELNDKKKVKKFENLKEKRQEIKIRRDIDYIPLNSNGSTEFGVMPLETLSKAPKTMAERAAEFREQMLYGSRIKRIPVSTLKMYQERRRLQRASFKYKMNQSSNLC